MVQVWFFLIEIFQKMRTMQEPFRRYLPVLTGPYNDVESFTITFPGEAGVQEFGSWDLPVIFETAGIRQLGPLGIPMSYVFVGPKRLCLGSLGSLTTPHSRLPKTVQVGSVHKKEFQCL